MNPIQVFIYATAPLEFLGVWIGFYLSLHAIIKKHVGPVSPDIRHYLNAAWKLFILPILVVIISPLMCMQIFLIIGEYQHYDCWPSSPAFNDTSLRSCAPGSVMITPFWKIEAHIVIFVASFLLGMFIGRAIIKGIWFMVRCYLGVAKSLANKPKNK